jgi:hypothetical protein
MGRAQALGFLEDGRQRIVPGHLVPLEFDLDFLTPGGGAELLQP